MFLLTLLAVCALSIYLAKIFNERVIINHCEFDRTVNYKITFVIFLSAGVVLFGIVLGQIRINSLLTQYSNKIELYIVSNHSNIHFVTNGIDLTEMQNNISLVNTQIDEISNIINIAGKELGVPNFALNWISCAIKAEINKWLAPINATKRISIAFADESNTLTVPSVLNGVHTSIMNVVNTIVFYCILAVIITLGFYIAISLYTAKSTIKRKNNHKLNVIQF